MWKILFSLIRPSLCVCPFPHLAARIIWLSVAHSVAAAYARATVSELQIREVVSEARELDEHTR